MYIPIPKTMQWKIFVLWKWTIPAVSGAKWMSPEWTCEPGLKGHTRNCQRLGISIWLHSVKGRKYNHLKPQKPENFHQQFTLQWYFRPFPKVSWKVLIINNGHRQTWKVLPSQRGFAETMTNETGGWSSLINVNRLLPSAPITTYHCHLSSASRKYITNHIKHFERFAFVLHKRDL